MVEMLTVPENSVSNVIPLLPACVCMFIDHVPKPLECFSKEGAMMSYTRENDNDFVQWSGSGHQHLGVL